MKYVTLRPRQWMGDMEMAMWIIKAFRGGTTPKSALSIARRVKQMGFWSIEEWKLCTSFSDGPWIVSYSDAPDSLPDPEYGERHRRQLMAMGATGDAESAIAFCKLEMQKIKAGT